jgi:spore coat protein U-like protein
MGVNVTVPPYVAVRVVAPGGTYEGGTENAQINFGTLTSGARREIELLVRANVNYSVALDSINAGTMANVAAVDTIPYRLEVDGVERGLSTGSAVVANGTGPTDLSGDPYRLAFEIGDTTGAASGTYQDVLTITVTAQ